MPDLRRVLTDHDLALLRLIAEVWDVELDSGAAREAADELAALMLTPDAADLAAAGLPPEARAALDALAADGRLPLAQFSRRFGELRAMGAARRDRERPWANDPSASETLWYRGFIGRAFFDDGRGPEEFVFIPDDLRPLLPLTAPPGAAPPAPGVPAPAPAPAAWATTAAAVAGDDAVTLLAFMQAAPVRLEDGALPARTHDALARYLRAPQALPLVLHLARQLGLLEGADSAVLKLDPARARPFLQAAAHERARLLAEAYRDSRDWNDLRRLPGLVFEGGAWRNDPLAARRAVLGLLAGVPAGVWWSAESFVASLKERQPDFQRPAGDYDSWYIRAADTQAYLRGFDHWEQVDGALVRWLLACPLHWLGLVDVSEPAGAFRLTAYGAALSGQAAWESAAPPEPPPGLELSADGQVRLPARANAYDRFQVARVSDWAPLSPDANPPSYLYRLSAAALGRAARKGITADRVLAFLERAAAGQPALPALARALRRWQKSGTELSLRHAAVLKLASADLLERLRREPSVRDCLGEALGPAAVVVPAEKLPQLRAALAELGILLDE